MKSIKTILNNKDVLQRFHLLQLYCIDVFTKSLSENEPTLSNLINTTMLASPDELSDSPEDIMNTLISLKKELETYNTKLMKINKLINIQAKYAAVLKSIDDAYQPIPNPVQPIIEHNQNIINGINSLTLNDITGANTIQSTKSAAGRLKSND